jgi:hypothetical protein
MKKLYSVVGIDTYGEVISLYFGNNLDAAKSEYTFYDLQKSERELRQVILIEQLILSGRVVSLEQLT